MKTLFNQITVALALASSLFATPALAQEAPVWILKSDAENEMTAHVAHTMHAADFVSKKFSFTAEVESLDKGTPLVVAIDEIKIPFRSFNSGNASRDSNALDTMKAYTHPNLILTPSDATFKVVQRTPTKLVADVDLVGDFNVAGVVKKDKAIHARFETDFKQWTLTGDFQLLLSEHNIEAPSLMFLTVDNIVPIKFIVKGNVVAPTDNGASTTPPPATK